MKVPNWASCSETDLWQYVAWHLKGAGIDSVLVGGAVVSIYSEGLYKSGDLDILTYEDSVKRLDEVMKSIGFVKKAMHYRHPKCAHLYIQFVSGPLGIGDDLNVRPKSIKIDGKEIKILTPTDCIRDRLSAYIHDRVRAPFEQAVLVASKQPFESAKIKRWLTDEGRSEVFIEFTNALKSGK